MSLNKVVVVVVSQMETSHTGVLIYNKGLEYVLFLQPYPLPIERPLEVNEFLSYSLISLKSHLYYNIF